MRLASRRRADDYAKNYTSEHMQLPGYPIVCTSSITTRSEKKMLRIGKPPYDPLQLATIVLRRCLA